jgi:CRISPR/Cas system CSM-associated protein Csm3 (group 7 of RAMP superfamily)
VADAFMATPDVETQIRDCVGIDRQARVAARRGNVKFDQEVLLPGAVFSLHLEWFLATEPTTHPELQQAHLMAEHLLAVVLAEWEQERGGIGGRTSRGLGAFRLEDLQRVRCDLHNKAALLTFLKDDTPWQHGQPVNGWLLQHLDEARKALQPLATVLRLHMAHVNQHLKESSKALQSLPDDHQLFGIAQRWLEVRCTFEADGPFLVNDPVAQAQSGFDHAPLGLGFVKPDQSAPPIPVLPGASLRGALRSQAERVVRTLATWNARKQTKEPPQDHFFARCPACDPNTRRQRDPNSPPVDLESCDSLLRVAGVESDAEVKEADLCLACWLFGSARRGSRLVVEDACYMGQKPTYKPRDFLAIDRFTGGGAEHLKFDAIEIWKPRFETRLRLENPEEWELGWLLLTLRDVQDGLVPFGFGAAKGMGRMRVVQWTARLGFLLPNDIPGGLPTGITTTDSGLYRVAETTWTPQTPPAAWQSQAESWVQAFTNKVNGFERHGRLRALEKDTYFDSDQMTRLYPAEVQIDGTN